MVTYFFPGNIFDCRDYRIIIHPSLGEIKILIVGGEGWSARQNTTTLISHQDVCGICAWLNANECSTVERIL
jgi:hypothetical protein